MVWLIVKMLPTSAMLKPPLKVDQLTVWPSMVVIAVPVICKVPPANVIAVFGPPRLPSSLMLSSPAVRIVPPL